MRMWLRLTLTVPLVLLGAPWLHAAVAWDRVRRREPLAGAGYRAQSAWCRLFCRCFGVRVSLRGGELLPPPTLVVANHISWLDIVCIAGQTPVAFLSKAEVRRWPLIGRVATALGTLYIERGRRQAAENAVESIRFRLEDGHRVVVFPEGTTSDGTCVLPFRPRLYQAAIDAGVPVQTIAVSYRRSDGEPCTEIAFTGEQGLLSNLAALARTAEVHATLTVGSAIAHDQGGRSVLARRSRDAIARALPGQGGESESPAEEGAAMKRNEGNVVTRL